MKIAILTLGCKLNYAESSTYERAFVKAGYEVVRWQDKTDLYLVNTCSVTATADSKSRNLIRKVHRVNPEARILVTGCSAQLRRSEIEAIEGVSRVFGCDEKHLVCPSGDVHSVTAGGIFPAYSTGERTRSFLKVQDGCNNFCKYCTVPYARGESRNAPIGVCVANAGEIAAQGVKEIVLTGVNTGDFGRSTGESFLNLLKNLEKVDGIERYRISSIEPNLLSDEIIDWIASGTKFQPHFHIPLQAGSDTLLQAMGRHYDTAFFRKKIEYVRKRMEGPGKPEVFFGIDVMAGLPGETPELFREGLDFIESLRPAFIHVFPYSRRPGTPAASFPGQVDDAVKRERVEQLEQLSGRLHREFIDRHKGQKCKVLFESKEKGGKMGGYTANYIRITRDYDPAKVGRIVEETI
ncbi:MAG: tRNA (N(6)-L-threonylcarbamoyladenosine(37)-C(2))-methylthiotransferase MtaB [Bacteroidales bacterium]|nr:tRNA (N(6)-L-threonylcarbamoyladenosine(37)-C(2))-methylthiotransferase MtaB [Candidatus Cryptobacteroides fimicaballi]